MPVSATLLRHIPRSAATIFSAMGWYMFLAPVKVSSANFFPPSALLLDNDRYNGLKNFIRPWDRSMSLAGSNAPASPAANLSCSHLQRISLFLELAKFVQLIEGLDNVDGKSV